MCSCLFNCLSYFFPCCCKSSKVGVEYSTNIYEAAVQKIAKLEGLEPNPEGRRLVEIIAEAKISLENKAAAKEFLECAVNYSNINKDNKLIEQCKLLLIINGHTQENIDDWLKQAQDKFRVEGNKAIMSAAKEFGMT